MSDLRFREAPDWLLQSYIENKNRNPVVDGLNAAATIAQQYNQAKKQQQSDQLASRKLDATDQELAMKQREQFYNYGDISSLPKDQANQIGQPLEGPLTAEGVGPQKSPIIQHYESFLAQNPQGIRGQTMTEDMLYVKDPESGALTPAGTSRRPIKGKTIVSGPNASQNAMDFNMNKPRYVPDLKTPDGMPMEYTPAGGLAPARVQGGMKPVASKGDETAIGDATLLANQIPNIRKMFDAYRGKGNIMAKVQATGIGGVLDPEAKQSEDSLKLAAFTFGGKNLTTNEKEIVYGAMFPSWKDNDASRDSKEKILTNFMTGKIDLLQAANLLGPAGGPLREMLTRLQSQGGSGLDPAKKSRLEELRAKRAAGTLR